MSRKKSSRKTKNGYRSKLEEKHALELEGLGVEFSYETFSLPYVLERTYKPDFVVPRKKKTPLLIEVKGYLRPQDRTKMVAVKKLNPDADIRFLFARNQLISGSKMMYSDWCKKYGFPYAFGKIPKRWLK